MGMAGSKSKSPNSPVGPGISRRGFLKSATVGSGTVAGVALLGHAAPAEAEVCQSQFDLTTRSGALEPDRIVHSACQFCNALCALRVSIKDHRIIDVKGEPDDPVQAGDICVKAGMMTQLVYNRFRLREPMQRVSGAKGDPNSRFAPISWDEALGLIAQKFLALRDAGEARAIANKTSGRMPRGVGSIVGRFFQLLGSPNDTDVGPVCNDAGGDALGMSFGLGNFTNGYGVDGATGREDLGAARFFLLFGTNQGETHPVTFSYLLRSRKKTGARMVVIDPRQTPTGANADAWIAPRPHTDLALVLGILHHIIARDLYDHAFVKTWVLGFAELSQHLKDNRYTPEWAAGVTGVPAATIRWLAEAYATTRPAAIFCNAGISHQLNSFQTYRALTFLCAITGNIGVNGGGCNFMHNTWPGGLNLPPVSSAPPARGPALPVGPDFFAESILSGKPYRLRAVVTAGNPLLASAHSNKVKEAYRQLEFYVFTGLFMEESAYYADILLPVPSGFEMETVYMRRDDRGIRWQKAAAPRVGQSRADWEIWIDLAQVMARLDRKNPPSYWTDNFPLAWRDYSRLWAEFVAHTPAMGGMTQARMEQRREPLRWPCPSHAHPGVSTLYLDHPSWYEASAELDAARQPKRFLTPSGKVEIFTPALDARLAPAGHSALPVFYTHPEVQGKNPVPEFEADFIQNPINPQALTHKIHLTTSPDTLRHTYPLMGMIGRPSVVHFSSVTQWTFTGKQMNGVRLVQIHPRAAARAGIRNGDDILVESPRGSVTATAELTEHIREDTIFVPNTFGPNQKVADDVGTPLYAAANTLVDDRFYDNLSGQQAYKIFACRVLRAS